jgi:hypothetical protein
MHEHPEIYPATTPNASLPIYDDAIIKRLLMVGRYLIDDGLSPTEIEIDVFKGLTELDDLSSRRASVFRAGLGLCEPLSIRAASDLASAVARSLRGEPDRDFQRRFVLAHSRSRWAQASHDCGETLRRDGIDVTPANLEIGLMMLIGQSRRGCDLLLDQLPGCSIETRITIAVSDYFGSDA